MPKKMAPFPILPPRPCRNPDCAKTCKDRKHKKLPDGRHEFQPKTPWQEDCSTRCRNRWNYVNKTKAKREAEKVNGEGSA